MCGQRCTGSGFFRGCLGLGQPQRFGSSPSPVRFGVGVGAGQGQPWPPLEAGVMRPHSAAAAGNVCPLIRFCWPGIWTRAVRLVLPPRGGRCTETERECERAPRGKSTESELTPWPRDATPLSLHPSTGATDTSTSVCPSPWRRRRRGGRQGRPVAASSWVDVRRCRAVTFPLKMGKPPFQNRPSCGAEGALPSPQRGV